MGLVTDTFTNTFTYHQRRTKQLLSVLGGVVIVVVVVVGAGGGGGVVVVVVVVFVLFHYCQFCFTKVSFGSLFSVLVH